MNNQNESKNKITIDNTKFRDRNKGKIKTLVGNDEVWLSILNFELCVNNEKFLLKEILEQIYDNSDNIIKEKDAIVKRLEKINEEL